MVKSKVMKRKIPSLGIQRRVKARKEPDSAEPVYGESPDASPDETPSEQDFSKEEDEDKDFESEEDENSGDEHPSKAKLALSNVSFGALARAQASMPSEKRRKGHSDQESEDEDDSEDDGQTDRRGKKFAPVKRTSKHAPTEMSSKRPVSRKREFDTIAKPQARDPRFDPAINSNPGFDEAKAQKAYAFLDEYRSSEMSALRTEIKKTKNPEQKERLQRQLMSMESKKKAQDKKDRERRILEDHRREEKELVKQGKKPFYLKKAEQKKRLLTEQFKGMKKRQVDKSIERRRKKLASREKRELEHLQRRT